MNSVLDALRVLPVPLLEARGAVPAEPCFYAVWARFGAVPGISGPRHETADLQLSYVGIAPNGAELKATLPSRVVVGEHIRGTTATSTLRRTLAALLHERQLGQSRWTTKPVLVNRDEPALSEWMDENLQLTLVERREPWPVEAPVIAELEPPLNQADDAGYPLSEIMHEARKR